MDDKELEKKIDDLLKTEIHGEVWRLGCEDRERVKSQILALLQPKIEEAIRQIFGEIEERLFTRDGDGNLILRSAMNEDRIVKWWQALSGKGGEKNKEVK